MLRKITRAAVCGALLAGSGMALASQPLELSDEALDAVTAGFGHPIAIPADVPLSAAFAYAFTTAASTPGVDVIIDVNYAASAGADQFNTSVFNHAITITYP